MSESFLNRRQLLTTLGVTAGASLLPRVNEAKPKPKPQAASFIPCLNMSTIRGQKLGFVKELEVAAKAGFRSVEIWINTLQDYLKEGGTLSDARKRLSDLGITPENAIGFAQWIVDDEAARTKGMEQMKREMDQLAQVGCKRVATPPVGAQGHDAPIIDLRKAAERYRKVVELGVQTGVMPQLEMWGFAKNLNRLSDVMFVALESGHPSAKLLLDVYHIYKGGSNPDSLALIGKPAIEIFHVNDYTANFTREAITDADRVYPGDGVAPIRKILQAIRNPDRPIILSLEVFNKNYYAQDAQQVTQTAMAKMKAMIDNA